MFRSVEISGLIRAVRATDCSLLTAYYYQEEDVMEWKHVTGENKGDIVLYALSTCGWCKKTKGLLEELGVEYRFLDVDLLGDKEKGAVLKEMQRWNPRSSFPTVVINDEQCIVGYNPNRIKEELKL